jgi:hypothetical protein
MDPAGVVVSQCRLCRHAALGPAGAACKAFPSHIPDEILQNEADHRLPFEGDDGVRFEPRPDVHPALLANVLRELNALNRRGEPPGR